MDDDLPDDLTVKELLETYFRVEDLQKVLKAFDLPFSGRKSELLERVLSLINHRQYELEFIDKVKRKITQTYRQRVQPELDREMPRANSRHDWQTNRRSVNRHESRKSEANKQTVKRRYEDDYSYDESSDSDDNSSEASSDSSFNPDSYRSKSLINRKKKRIITSSSDESDKSDDRESDKDFESNSVKSNNKRQNNVIESSVKNKSKKSTEKKTKSKARNKKQKSKRIVYDSSSSDWSQDSEQIDSSDSDVVHRVRKTVKKNFLNVNLSSDSEDSDSNNEINNNTDTNIADNNMNNTNDDESDDEIEFLGEFKSNSSTNRINGLRVKSYSESHSLFKDSSSSNTESSVEMDCDDQNEISNLFTECDGNDPSLVIDNSSLNKCCDSNSDKATEANAIPLNTENTSIQSSVSTPTHSSIKPEMPSQTFEQMPSNSASTSPKIMFIKTPQIKAAPKQNIPKLPNKMPDKSVDELPEYIKLPVIDPNLTLSIIKKRINFDNTESSEIEAIDQIYKLSLICPITNKRVSIPARSNQCQHIECFDIHAFMSLNSNKKLDEWRCPKCKQPAKLKANESNIIIDGLVKQILSTTEPTCEAVIFNSNAIWSPDIKNPDNFSNKANSNDIILLDNTLEDIIELDDDEDLSLDPETQNTKSISSEIENAKSYANSVSNLIESNSNKEKTDSLATAVQQSQQKSVPPKETSIIDRSNPQIERIARFLSTVEQEISRLAQNPTINTELNVQTQQQRQQIQVSIPSAQESRPQFQEHQPIAQQSVPSQQQVTSLPNTCISNNSLNEQSLPHSSTPYLGSQQIVINRPTQQTYLTNGSNQNQVTSNSSSSTQSLNSYSSDHIKFELDSSGNICGTCTCQICNEQIVVSHQNIESHVNSERHKSLKQNYNKIQSSTVSTTNRLMSSFGQQRPQTHMNAQQMQTNYSYYNQHSTNNAFQTQYPMPPNYVSQRHYQQSHQNYFPQQYPQYYPQRPVYQSSVVRPARQSSGLPPSAHMTSQNSTQFSSMPTNYRDIAHHNQSYPYSYL